MGSKFFEPKIHKRKETEMVKWGNILTECCVVILMMMIGTSFCFGESEVVKIGVVGPMKFVGGDDGWKGAVLAEGEINATGGINVGGVKHKIELIKVDSNELLSVSDAVNAMERAIKINKVDFVIGGNRSEAVLGMQEVTAANKVIFMTCGGVHPQVSMRLAQDYDKYKHWFRSGTVNSQNLSDVVFGLVEMAIQKVRKDMGIKTPRLAILGEKAMWCDPLVKMGSDLFPKHGAEVVGVWRPSPLASDLTAEFTAIRKAGAHVIFTTFAGPLGITSVRQWGELKIPSALVGINNEAQKPQYREESGGMCNYEVTYIPVTKVKITNRTVPFCNNFAAKFSGFPTAFASGNYDSIYVLQEGIERAGTIHSDAVVEKIEKLEFNGVGGKVVYYPKNHKWPHDLTFGPGYVTHVGIQWRDGAQVGVWPDGHAVLGDRKWEGLRYEGTVDYELPPWMVTYWKGKEK